MLKQACERLELELHKAQQKVLAKAARMAQPEPIRIRLLIQDLDAKTIDAAARLLDDSWRCQNTLNDLVDDHECDSHDCADFESDLAEGKERLKVALARAAPIATEEIHLELDPAAAWADTCDDLQRRFGVDMWRSWEPDETEWFTEGDGQAMLADVGGFHYENPAKRQKQVTLNVLRAQV